MLKFANAYYEAIEFSDGNVASFADECQCRKNGIASANNQGPPPPDAQEEPAVGMEMFGRMKCSEQFSTGIRNYITKINQRRLFTVDEKFGLVMAFPMLITTANRIPLRLRE